MIIKIIININTMCCKTSAFYCILDVTISLSYQKFVENKDNAINSRVFFENTLILNSFISLSYKNTQMLLIT